MKIHDIARFLAVLLVMGLLWLNPGGVAAQASAQLGFFEDVEVQPNGRVEVPVEVRGVSELYAVDLEIRFDPNRVQVEDADPNNPGVQPALGTFLDAGLTLFNTVDNTQGVIRFAMTQVNPSEPKSGDGVLLVLYLVGIREGESTLAVSFVEASDRLGDAIPMTGVDSPMAVTVSAGDQHATPIQIQDPTQMIALTPPDNSEFPSRNPTITPTTAPTETLTAETGLAEEPGTAAEQGGATQASMPESAQQEQENGFSILDYWWLVLVVLLLVAGTIVLMLKIKKR